MAGPNIEELFEAIEKNGIAVEGRRVVRANLAAVATTTGWEEAFCAFCTEGRKNGVRFCWETENLPRDRMEAQRVYEQIKTDFIRLGLSDRTAAVFWNNITKHHQPFELRWAREQKKMDPDLSRELHEKSDKGAGYFAIDTSPEGSASIFGDYDYGQLTKPTR